MTAKRQHAANQSYRDFRAIVIGEEYLDGSKDVLLYLHALNCKEYGQTASLLCANGSQYESIGLDRTGDRSQQWRYTNAGISRLVRRRSELERGAHVWAHDRPAEDIFVSESGEVAAILEMLDLYPDEDSWLISFEDWGVEQTVYRPSDMSDNYPPHVNFKPMPPRFLLHHGVERAKEIVSEAIALRELARDALRAKGAAVPLDLPGRCRPHVAFVGDDALVARAEAEYEQFQDDHEYARRRFKGGQRDVEFPCGTVFWRLRADVRVAAAPPGSVVLGTA